MSYLWKIYSILLKIVSIKNLPDGELNPGLPRDRRGYSALYYRGFDMKVDVLYGT